MALFVREQSLAGRSGLPSSFDPVTATLEFSEAPEPDQAFEDIALSWLLGLDVRRYLHPAVQAAIADAYSGAHLSGARSGGLDYADALLGTAFSKNYEGYHLLRWRSNFAGREQMVRDFPQQSPAEKANLPRLADIEELIEELGKDEARLQQDAKLIDALLELEETARSLTENHRSLPVILRRGLRRRFTEINRAAGHLPRHPFGLLY